MEILVYLVPETVSPLHVRSEVCIAPFYVRSKDYEFATHLEGSNANFAQHMEQRHSFRDQQTAKIATSANCFFLLSLKPPIS